MSDDPIPKDVFLKDRFTYPHWFLSLRFNALSRGVWHLIDPDAPDADRPTGPGKLPSLEEYTEQAIARAKGEHAQARANWEDSGRQGPAPEAPKELPAKELEAKYDKDLIRLAEDHRKESKEAAKLDARYLNIQTWINATVESQILHNAQASLVLQGKTTVQDLLRELKDQFAPSPMSTVTTVREDYRKALRQAEVGHMKPDQWHKTWFTAYSRAKTYHLQEVEGTLAAKDFLSAVAKRLAPDWGQRELANLIRDDSLGRPTMTLKELGDWFSAMCHENKLRAETKEPGIFATLTPGSQPEGGAPSQPNAGSSTSRAPKKKGNKCPCLATLDKTHPWEPNDCAGLRFAITGVVARRIRHFSQEELEGIRERFKHNRWKKLRDDLAKLPEWKESIRSLMRRSEPNTNPSSNVQFGNITAALIDPQTLDALDPAPGIYTTIHFGRHPLSQSTLIDNCGAKHLVNTRDLLVPGTFVPDTTGQTVEAGTSSLPISGTGQRVIKGALLGASGEPEHDLILKDVVVVEGFHVNIVSEALLRRAGIWYCGLDCSLRMGEISTSVILAKLEQAHNLAFLEYKPMSS